MFEELLGSVGEAGAILRGRQNLRGVPRDRLPHFCA